MRIDQKGSDGVPPSHTGERCVSRGLVARPLLSMLLGWNAGLLAAYDHLLPLGFRPRGLGRRGVGTVIRL